MQVTKIIKSSNTTAGRMLLSILLSILCTGKLYAQKHFGEYIYFSSKAGKETEEAVKDLAYWLERAGHSKMSVRNDRTGKKEGIIVQLYDDPIAEVSNRIRNSIRQDGQSFHLEVKSSGDVVITGSGSKSLVNGIYTFLHELGFRWYMPGEIWTIIPSLKKIPEIDKVYTPSFLNRIYFGSGGITPIPGIDPDDTFSKDYILWNQRNRLSTDYQYKGHMGKAFYAAMKTELDKHPEYFCFGKVNKNAWLDFNRREAVDLFIRWALSLAKPGDRFPSIGVDPADGSSLTTDCIPSGIPEVKTLSDKYFWLANQVAGSLPQDDNKTRVSIMAYSQYATPPAFRLHKNVYPVIIPYAFQDVTPPLEFINMWSQKLEGRQMGIYDYWNITQWSKSLPQFNIYSIKERLLLWKSRNITSIQLESTYSKGAMGHAFWIATQMMWNMSLSFDSLYNDFLITCFGPGANDIKRMYDRWSLRYQSTMEPVLSNQDLAAAASKTKDPVILKRIAELKAYVRYMKMYEAYSINMTTGGYDSLIMYTNSIHHLRMIHTSALQVYYIPKPKNYPAITDKKVLAARNNKAKILSYTDIERNFTEDIRNSPEAYRISDFVFDVRKASFDTDNQKKVSPLYINNRNTYQFFLDRKRTFTIRAGATKNTALEVKDSTGKVWYKDTVNASKTDYRNISITLPRGYYSLLFGDASRFSRVTFPEDIVFVSEDHGYDNAGFPWHYIYFPKDVSEVVYFDNHGPGLNDRGFWLDPQGKKIMPQKIAAKIYKVTVPPQYRGKTWILNIGHRKFEMLNIPDIYSLNKFSYQE